ncbi:hypothetical protein BURCENBC7_AP5352 [Burkholderia cenocepacia BC7]|nr:hypothetical protein BURCENK562V_C2388 [Burkholderia cenocepacia K56-2Valvano]ERI30604.1 hypothetical protein BURCENBC7_AP5352 [Burkholderia cenocepacia BC7]
MHRQFLQSLSVFLFLRFLLRNEPDRLTYRLTSNGFHAAL